MKQNKYRIPTYKPIKVRNMMTGKFEKIKRTNVTFPQFMLIGNVLLKKVELKNEKPR